MTTPRKTVGKTNVLIALHRIGPYHHARFTKAAESLDLAILETRPSSTEYPWLPIASKAYHRHALSGQEHPEADPPNEALEHQLNAIVDALNPRVIVSVGWADRAYQRLLIIATRRRIPVVLVSDSRWQDEPRSPIKESVKRILLLGYSAALVAGKQSRSYLEQLGFPSQLISQPWDVVDNDAFMAASQLPSRLQQSEPHFLCVSRFEAKKNHLGLLRAFGQYQRQGGKWALRLIGSGIMEPEIEAAIATLPEPERVKMLPFQQIDQLALSYSQASAFILASTTDQWGLVVNEAMAAGLPVLVSQACGCAVDLVTHASTGWIFDPENSFAITDSLHTAEHQPDQDRREMVEAARTRIQAFGLGTFASGLEAAVEASTQNPRLNRLSCLLAQIVSHR
jgi:glycosyltransferase involved in cell wall biosynthesis